MNRGNFKDTQVKILCLHVVVIEKEEGGLAHGIGEL